MQQKTAKLLEIEQAGEIVVIVPQSDLSELAFEQLEAEASDVLEIVDKVQAKNVVIDFHKSNYFGSTALGFFMKLWLRVRRRNGHMAFCNMSEHEKEVLHITKTDGLWPICSSRKEAIDRLGT
jgi:anti-anti-sigma factor